MPRYGVSSYTWWKYGVLSSNTGIPVASMDRSRRSTNMSSADVSSWRSTPSCRGRRPCVVGLLGELGRVRHEGDGRDGRVDGEEEGGVDPTGEQERGIVTGDLVEARLERGVDGGEVFVPWPLLGIVGRLWRSGPWSTHRT